MKRLIPYINHEMRILEAALQTEESGTKIASIQGTLAGYKSMISLLNEIEITDFKIIKESEKLPCTYKPDMQRWVCLSDDFDTVYQLHSIFRDVEEKLKRFNELGEEKVKQKKDWLFYEAEKGRDLHIVKGWFFAFKVLNDWKEAIDKQYEWLLRDKKNSLSFEDDED